MGSHAYTITATDRSGQVSTLTGTFEVTRTGPTISQIGMSVSKGQISWNAYDADGVAACSLRIDGVLVQKVYGPYKAASGANYIAKFGSLSTGSHTYTITATDRRGYVTWTGGSIAVPAIGPGAIAGGRRRVCHVGVAGRRGFERQSKRQTPIAFFDKVRYLSPLRSGQGCPDEKSHGGCCLERPTKCIDRRSIGRDPRSAANRAGTPRSADPVGQPGEDGPELARRHQPDLIVLDLELDDCRPGYSCRRSAAAEAVRRVRVPAALVLLGSLRGWRDGVPDGRIRGQALSLRPLDS